MNRFFLFACLLSCPCPVNAQDLPYIVAEGINSIRASHGLPRLRREPRLDSAAASQANWMAAVGRMDHLREPPRSLDEYRTCDHHPANRVINSGYFSFGDLFRIDYNNGGAVVHPTRANTHVGEIIAAGRGGGPSVRRPDIILAGWMNSSGHRATILNPGFNEFGSAVAARGGDVYWCVVFGMRER